MPRINVGVIGCGRIAQQRHIPNYLQNPKSELQAVCDVNQDVSNKIAMKYGVEHAFSDYKQLLKSGLVEAVSVCVPTSLHSEVVVNAANCGVHVLCEKPLATSMHEADEMLKAATNSGIKLAVGFNLRFLANHMKVKEYLQEGRIGRPILVRAQVVNPGPYGTPEATSYSTEAERRGGCLFDSAPHLVDLIIWMFGRPSEVSACVSTYVGGVNVDDSAMMLVKFESGVLASISVAWLNLPDYQAMEESRRVEIIGTNGKIESDCFGPSFFFYSVNSLASRLRGRIKITPVRFDPKIPDEALSRSYRDEIDDFLTSVIRNGEPKVSGQQAREGLSVVLAAYESARTKSTVFPLK